MATTYHGGTQIDRAQAVLDRHTVSSADGMCVTCKLPDPCPEREAAAKVFTSSARLPRRRPGATRPDLLDARPNGFRWLVPPDG